MTDILPRRMPSIDWRAVKDPQVKQQYLALEAKLLQQRMLPVKCARTLSTLCQFLWCFEDEAAMYYLDLRRLSATAPGVAAAHAAWQKMQSLGSWKPSHIQKVRTLLGTAISLVVEALAVVINPVMRMRNRRIVPRASQFQPFDVHTCLPMRVRLRPHGDHEARLLLHLAQKLVDGHLLRSYSRENIQKILLFFDHLFHGDGTVPAVSYEDGFDARWNAAQRLRPHHWTDRLDALWTGAASKRCGDKENGEQVSFNNLKRNVRWLSLLHNKMLHPSSKFQFPILQQACVTEKVATSNKWMRGNVSSASESSSSSSNTDAQGQRDTAEEQLVRDTVSSLCTRFCRDTDMFSAATKVVALTPDEARRVLESAITTLERLVVMIFLTTGVRLGGMTHIELPKLDSAVRYGCDFTQTVDTREKGGKHRKLIFNKATRILAARWWRDQRGPSPTLKLFPSPKDQTKDVSRRYIWELCHRVFERAGVPTDHAHPHAFRHTVIKMLLGAGWPLEKVSKFVGHASPQVTEQKYNRLTELEYAEVAAAMDVDQNSWAAEQKTKWMSLLEFVKEPYQYEDVEWQGLREPARHEETSRKKRKARLIEEARDDHQARERPT